MDRKKHNLYLGLFTTSVTALKERIYKKGISADSTTKRDKNN